MDFPTYIYIYTYITLYNISLQSMCRQNKSLDGLQSPLFHRRKPAGSAAATGCDGLSRTSGREVDGHRESRTGLRGAAKKKIKTKQGRDNGSQPPLKKNIFLKKQPALKFEGLLLGPTSNGL